MEFYRQRIIHSIWKTILPHSEAVQITMVELPGSQQKENRLGACWRLDTIENDFKLWQEMVRSSENAKKYKNRTHG